MGLLCITFCLSATLLGFSPYFCLPKAEPTTSAPTCPPKDYYNNIIDKCEPKYQWVNYTAGLENDPRLVHLDNGSNTTIARFIRKNNASVVDWRTDFLKNILINDMRLEVLLAEPGYYGWQPSSNGAIPDNAIEGGQNQNKTVYVCRTINDKGDYYAGMVIPGNRTCNSELLLADNSTYEVMIYK